VADVYVGEGALDGKGIYAGRSFAEGQVVVPYRLRKLNREEYLALNSTERLFVHSYWGERHLYPPPARFVNHSDAPNMYQDFEREADIALRRIEAGEFLTIDAREETNQELATFMRAYESAVNAGDRDKLASLVDDAAVVWLPSRPAATKRDLLEDECAGDRVLSLHEVRWIVATGRWEAVGSYDFRLTPGRFAALAYMAGHVTDVVRVIDGNWQLVYRHVSDG
jgi:hypothetical protein